MSKTERIVYFLIITAEFIIILFLYSKSAGTKSQNRFKDIGAVSQQVYSFYGCNANDENVLVHFTAYSDLSYIFVTFSSHCSHCNDFLDKFKEFFLNKEIDKTTQVIFLISYSEEALKVDKNSQCLKISHDDFVQFGFDTPAIYAVNGKGDILYRHGGYEKGIFKKVLESIYRDKRKNSKSIN